MAKTPREDIAALGAEVEQWRRDAPEMMSAQRWESHVQTLAEMERLAGSALAGAAEALEMLRTQFTGDIQADMRGFMDRNLQQVMAVANRLRTQEAVPVQGGD